MTEIDSGEIHSYCSEYWAQPQSSGAYQATLLPAPDQRALLLPSSKALSPIEVAAKVSAWLDTQYPPISSELPRIPGYENSRSLAIPFSLPKTGRKLVHWAPSVEDNHGKTELWLKTQVYDGAKQTEVPRQVKSYRKAPAVPDLPRKRRPPPVPRPRRLPTPELPELQHAQYCACCSMNPIEKMDAQLAVAAMHIADAKQSAWR